MGTTQSLLPTPNATTPTVPRLPQELINHIISILIEDKATLFACALVSRSFHHPSYSHLYSSYDLELNLSRQGMEYRSCHAEFVSAQDALERCRLDRRMSYRTHRARASRDMDDDLVQKEKELALEVDCLKRRLNLLKARRDSLSFFLEFISFAVDARAYIKKLKMHSSIYKPDERIDHVQLYQLRRILHTLPFLLSLQLENVEITGSPHWVDEDVSRDTRIPHLSLKHVVFSTQQYPLSLENLLKLFSRIDDLYLCRTSGCLTLTHRWSLDDLWQSRLDPSMLVSMDTETDFLNQVALSGRPEQSFLEATLEDWPDLADLQHYLKNHGRTVDSLKVILMGALPFYERIRIFDLDYRGSQSQSLVLDFSNCTRAKTFELKLMVRSLFGDCQDYVQYTCYIAKIISTIPKSKSSNIEDCSFVMHIDFVDLQLREMRQSLGIAFGWRYLNDTLDQCRGLKSVKFVLRTVKAASRPKALVYPMDDEGILEIFRSSLPAVRRWGDNVFTALV
ncbi:hypothetical protein ABKN59_011754 [Abortiporus biennis]